MTSEPWTVLLRETPDAQDLAIVYDGLRRFNTEAAGTFVQKPLHLFAYDSAGTVIGGLFGAIGWGWLHIDILWVAETARGQGLGTRLLDQAEAEALALGIGNAYLETADFQAADFYQRQGYAVFGILDDQPPGHRCFYMKKALGSPPGEQAPA